MTVISMDSLHTEELREALQKTFGNSAQQQAFLRRSFLSCWG